MNNQTNKFLNHFLPKNGTAFLFAEIEVEIDSMSSFGFRTKFRLSAALFTPPGQKSKRLVFVPKIAQKLLVRVFPLANRKS